MVYNNFFYRSLISLLFLFIYISISFYDFNYIFYLILALYLIIFIEVIIFFHKYIIIILLYLLISLFFVINIKFDSNSFIKFNLMILTIISFDIFSYIIGKSIGKYKILKFISPNKTLEGFVGGCLFSFIITIILCLIIDIKIDFNLMSAFFIIIFSSFLGDIIESFFKRINNLKNSSNFLPGHGGFFDRFDGFILALIFYPIYNSLILL